MSNILLVDKLTTEGFLNSFEENYVKMVTDSTPKNGEGTIYYKGKYNGYSLQATWVDGKREGNALMKTDHGVHFAELVFVNDVINGVCTIYNEVNDVVFKGMMVNGMKDGICQLFDMKEKMKLAGFYEKGIKICDLIQSSFDQSLWIELSARGDLQCIGKRTADLQGRDGRCVEYDSENKPVAVVEYANREIIKTIKSFNGDEMTEYDDNNTPIYKGGYLNNYHLSFPRHGSGMEMDRNSNMLYSGNYSHGVRHGEGTSFVDGKKEYRGEWCNGMPEGTGQWYDSDTKELLYDGKVVGKYQEIKKGKKYRKIGEKKPICIATLCVPSKRTVDGLLGVSKIEMPTGDVDMGTWYLTADYGKDVSNKKQKKGTKNDKNIKKVKKIKKTKVLPIRIFKGMRLNCRCCTCGIPPWLYWFVVICVLLLLVYPTFFILRWVISLCRRSYQINSCFDYNIIPWGVKTLKIDYNACYNGKIFSLVGYSKLETVTFDQYAFSYTGYVRFESKSIWYELFR